VAANLLVSDITKGCRDFYKLLQETHCGFASATFYRRVTEHPHNSVIPYWGPGLVSSLKALGRNNSVKALRKKFKTLLPRKDPRDLRQRLTNSYMLMPHGSSIGVKSTYRILSFFMVGSSHICHFLVRVNIVNAH